MAAEKEHGGGAEGGQMWVVCGEGGLEAEASGETGQSETDQTKTGQTETGVGSPAMKGPQWMPRRRERGGSERSAWKRGGLRFRISGFGFRV